MAPNVLTLDQSRPEAVLFDIGMTMIFPSGDVIVREIHRLVPETDIRPADAARALAIAAEAHHFRIGDSISDADLVGVVMGNLLGLPANIGIAAWRMSNQSADLYSVLDPHAGTVLEALRSMGIKTGAVSNAINCIHDELAEFGLLQHFDIVVGSSDGYREKPASDMFRSALEGLGADALSSWHVGDGLINDVLGASRARIGEQILVDKYGIYAKPPCPTVDSMAELLEIVTRL